MRTIDFTRLAFGFLLSIFLLGCSSDSQSGSEATDAGNTTNTEAQAVTKTQLPDATAADGANAGQKTIAQQAATISDLSVFSEAFEKSGLLTELNSTGPYTVFIPSNKAFEALPGGTLDNLLKPENKKQLAELMNHHIVAGKLDTATLQHGSKIKTLGNEQLEVSKQEEVVMINGAEIQKANLHSSNGVIHVIDKVLMPKSK